MDPLVVSGEILRILHRSSHSRYSVVLFRPKDEASTQVAVGDLAGVRPGEQVTLRGHWQENPRYGRRLMVSEVTAELPISLQGLERYLASGVVSGIGPELAHRLVATYGQQLPELLNRGDPSAIAIPMLGQARAQALVALWLDKREMREQLLELLRLGLSLSLAERILRRYGGTTLLRVRADPWRLARDIRGIGLKQADAVALSLGIEVDAPERIRAAILHTLHRAGEDGHVFLPEPSLFESLAPLKLNPAPLLRAVAELVSQRQIIAESSTASSPRSLYLSALHRAEISVAERLSVMLTQRPLELRPDLEKRVTDIANAMGLTLGHKQLEAIIQASSRPLTVITGGPGTGKTTLLRVLLEVLEPLGTFTLLAAPSGRAARRLSEAARRPATTLHRLLEMMPPDMAPRRHAAHPLEAELLIVDEASMIDLPLFSQLLSALAPKSRLVLIGDVDQLPPVGPGHVLRDVLEIPGVCIVSLDEVYRQDRHSLIALNARRVRLGLPPRAMTGAEAGQTDFFLMAATSPEQTQALLVDLVVRRLPQRYGLDPVRDIQVLSPSRRGRLGVDALNERLHAALSSRKPSVSSCRFEVGDKVIQTRNNYDLELFNGDLGIVTRAEPEHLEVRFDGHMKLLKDEDADDLELAYALTIHKSQGSEFPAVVVPVVDEHRSMLRRNLIYTALTRARHLVVVIAHPEALEAAVKRSGGEKRYGELARRCREPYERGLV